MNKKVFFKIKNFRAFFLNKSRLFHSKIVDVEISNNFDVIITPAWKDNYSYIFVDKSSNQAGCVDVIQSKK